MLLTICISLVSLAGNALLIVPGLSTESDSARHFRQSFAVFNTITNIAYYIQLIAVEVTKQSRSDKTGICLLILCNGWQLSATFFSCISAALSITLDSEFSDLFICTPLWVGFLLINLLILVTSVVISTVSSTSPEIISLVHIGLTVGCYFFGLFGVWYRFWKLRATMKKIKPGTPSANPVSDPINASSSVRTVVVMSTSCLPLLYSITSMKMDAGYLTTRWPFYLQCASSLTVSMCFVLPLVIFSFKSNREVLTTKLGTFFVTVKSIVCVTGLE